MKRIIGLAGTKRAGKNHTASIVRRLCHHTEFHEVALADALKQEVATATGYSVGHIEAHKEEFRPILQWWGTEFRRRMHGDDYWIKRLIEKLVNISEGVVVVTDIRFPNEADTVKMLGGEVWQVVNPESSCDTDFHPSEIALDNYSGFSAVLLNHRSIPETTYTGLIATTLGYE